MANCTSNLTSGFIDLATYDELEKYMYGGADATAYFVRETRKSTWFTQVPVVLSNASGNAQWGQEWSVTISRAGDYLLNTWLRVNIPSIIPAQLVTGGPTAAALDGTTDLATINNPLGVTSPAFGLVWTPNLMHNLVKECCITFNDLVAARFDSHHLDFWAAFTTPEGKRQGYANMIGNTPNLAAEMAFGGMSAARSTRLPAATLNLPLPLFYSRDSGVALPTAALPYNDMRINFSFRPITELLQKVVPCNNTAITAVNSELGAYRCVPVQASDFLNSQIPPLGVTQVWANYAIVSNDERKRMACAPRDILIEQVQSAPVINWNPSGQNNYDIRFSHAIKVLFFAARNKTCPAARSNYTTQSQVISSTTSLNNTDPFVALMLPSTGNRSGVDAADPIEATHLTYENTMRLGAMGSDYYSLVQPWYHAPRIPVVTGYHMYSYSLDFICLDPLGSTNYGKLTNVSLSPDGSAFADAASGGAVVRQVGLNVPNANVVFTNFSTNQPQNAVSSGGSGRLLVLANKQTVTLEAAPANGTVNGQSIATLDIQTQSFDFIVTAVNNNIIRVSGGALGFPVL